MDLLCLIGIWIVCGVAAGSIYNERGHNALLGILVGLIFGPIGVVLVLLTPRNTAVLEQRQLSGQQSKKCPFCAELIRYDARVCRYCGRNLPT